MWGPAVLPSHYSCPGWYVEGRWFPLTAQGLNHALSFASSLALDYARPIAVQTCREPGKVRDCWRFDPEGAPDGLGGPTSDDLAELVASLG